MFIAITKSGKMISTLSHSKMELQLQKKREAFFCPSCKEEVLLKIGSIKNPHFAHRSKCVYTTENETEEHLMGKKVLYDWLQNQMEQVELEKFFHEISSRPDIYAEWKKRKMAIEFQCSHISKDEILKRTKKFYQIEIVPIWMVHSKHIKLNKQFHLHLNDFLSSMIHGPHLYALDPLNREIWIITHFLPISKLRCLATIHRYSLSSRISFSSMFQKKPLTISMFDRWIHDTILWLYRLPIKPYARKIPFLHSLYHHQIHPLQLPPIIGLPLPNMHFFETPPLEWQTYLWLFKLKNKRKGDSITKDELFHWTHSFINKNRIKLREIPNITIKNGFHMIIQYMELLGEIGYVKKKQDNYFVNKQIHALSSRLEENVNKRKNFFHHYKGKIITFYMKKY